MAAGAPGISISQVGLHFICTADGQPDMYSWRLPTKNPQPNLDLAEKDYIIPVIADEDLTMAATGALPLVSGGRTALRIREDNPEDAGLVIEMGSVPGFSGGAGAVLTNLPAIHWGDFEQIKKRYYSNYPPLTNPGQAGRYGTVATGSEVGDPNYGRRFQRHPGYDPANWNWTLDRDTPLAVNQKRIQAMLHLELNLPPTTDPDAHFDYTLVISAEDMSSIEVNGLAAFSSNEPVVLRLDRSHFETAGVAAVGGLVNSGRLYLGRNAGPHAPMPEDSGYDPTPAANQMSLNMDLLSRFLTLTRDQNLIFASGTITLKIYNKYVSPRTTEEPLQFVKFRLPEGLAPAPDLVTTGSYVVDYIKPDSTRYHHPAIQAPRWWGFNRDGVLGSFDSSGVPNPDINLPASRSARGRFFEWGTSAYGNNLVASDPRLLSTSYRQRIPGVRALFYGYDELLYPDVAQVPVAELVADPLRRIAYAAPSFDRPLHYGTDTLRFLDNANPLTPAPVVNSADFSPGPAYNDLEVHMSQGFAYEFPRVTFQPVSHERAAGQSSTLTVGVNTPVTYQWRFYGVPVPGATSRNFVIPAMSASDVGSYDVVVTNLKGSSISEPAQLNLTDPAIVTQPVATTVSAGSPAALSVTAEGTGLKYQWRRNGLALAKGAGSSLAWAKVQVADAGIYDVLITGAQGTVASAKVKLTVTTDLAIVQQPVGGTIRGGGGLTLKVQATGTGPITYRWFSGETPVNGATSSQFGVTGAPGSSSSYKVVVTNDTASITSATVQVIVLADLPVITQNPQPVSVEPGGSPSFTVATTGEGLSYQWRRNGVNVAKATSATLVLSKVKAAQAGAYDCVVKNSGGSVLSHSAALTIGSTLVFETLPADQVVAHGAAATFSASVAGQASYQWSFNGKAIVGAIYNSLTIPDADVSKAGSYTVTATQGSLKAAASALLSVQDDAVLIYKLTGTGQTYAGTSAQRVALTGSLVIKGDDETPQAATVLIFKEGSTTFFQVQRRIHFRSDSTGPAPKSQTVFSDLDENEAAPRSILWLQGPSSLVKLSPTQQALAPLTLSGIANGLHLDSIGGATTVETISFKAALDTTSTATAGHKAETLDQTLERLTVDLLQKGYVEIPQ